MRKKRPAAVLVMAILNLVFGGGMLACYVCIGGVLLIGFAALSQAGAQQDAQVREMKEAFASMAREIPGFVPLLVGEVGSGLFLSILLVVCGIGLLGMRPWARYGSLFCAAAIILVVIADIAVQVVYLEPAMRRWQQNYVARHGGGMVAPDPMDQNPVANYAGQAVGAVLKVGYAIALLVVLNLPQVRAAFAGPRPGDEYDADRAAEEEDELGYGRHREDEGWGEGG